jgi:hypothetical protein
MRLDLYTFECRECGVWHIEEGDAVEGPPAILELFLQLSRDGGGARRRRHGSCRKVRAAKTMLFVGTYQLEN